MHFASRSFPQATTTIFPFCLINFNINNIKFRPVTGDSFHQSQLVGRLCSISPRSLPHHGVTGDQTAQEVVQFLLRAATIIIVAMSLAKRTAAVGGRISERGDANAIALTAVTNALHLKMNMMQLMNTYINFQILRKWL